jgi:predicted amidophosphoribosyltransferase
VSENIAGLWNYNSMVCRNLCERLYSKIIFGNSHYAGGKKYCRGCEIYFSYDGVFCPCCGMALRSSSTSKRDKERLRQLQVRREEQDRIIKVIKGIKN